MKFLLIGGRGYLGRRLTAYLNERGHRVTVTTRSKHRPSDRLKAKVLSGFQLSKFKNLPGLLSEHDVIVYLAGPNEAEARESPALALQASGFDLWRLCSALAALPKRPPVIFLSTIHVYGSPLRGDLTENHTLHPHSSYSLGKVLGEHILRLFRERQRVPSLSIRLSNGFGAPAGSDGGAQGLVFNDFCRQAVWDRLIVLRTPGLQQRNFVTLQDVVRAIEWLARRPKRWPKDGLLHLGSPLQITIRQAAELVAGYTKEKFGFLPAIVAPTMRGQKPPAFSFSRKRLSSIGFRWKLSVTHEINQMLQFYAAHRS